MSTGVHQNTWVIDWSAPFLYSNIWGALRDLVSFPQLRKPWKTCAFFTFLKLYKGHQIAQSISFSLWNLNAICTLLYHFYCWVWISNFFNEKLFHFHCSKKLFLITWSFMWVYMLLNTRVFSESFDIWKGLGCV